MSNFYVHFCIFFIKIFVLFKRIFWKKLKDSKDTPQHDIKHRLQPKINPIENLRPSKVYKREIEGQKHTVIVAQVFAQERKISMQ